MQWEVSSELMHLEALVESSIRIEKSEGVLDQHFGIRILLLGGASLKESVFTPVFQYYSLSSQSLATTLIIPITACYSLELRSAKTI